MSSRRAACEPCRRSKLACDHVKPACGRCVAMNRADSCAYRSSPFRRQRGASMLTAETTTTAAQGPNTRQRRYPNPGYLGQSSHTNIYAQLLPLEDRLQKSSPSISRTTPPTKKSVLQEAELARGRGLLEDIGTKPSIEYCINLVNEWLLRGSNLALATQFVMPALRTVRLHFVQNIRAVESEMLARKLFENSSSSLVWTHESTIDDFCNQICFENARWETFGLFFTSVSMATIDIVRHPQLYESQLQRHDLRKLALRFSDQCLALSLGLDCLNDIQLVLQYENFINHSYTNGDQSFDSWRRLGDIISSIYALGYHERGRDRDGCPSYLKYIREAVFAFTYSAYKNISIFLGRPPRMHHVYCDFSDFHSLPAQHEADFASPKSFLGWVPDRPFSYMIEAWWSMNCALQKEEVLAIFREECAFEKKRRTGLVTARIEKLWSVLPKRFQLTGKLISFGETPIERDFAAGARLNFLHIRFLLQLALSRNGPATELELLTVSLDILSLVNEENMIKEQLTSSGTGLVWRTTYHGLPAAGILCLALLNGALRERSRQTLLIGSHQNLNVLLAQLNAGVLVDVDEPNYPLLMEAATTIKIILNRAVLPSMQDLNQAHDQSVVVEDVAPSEDADMWLPWSSFDTWDFEIPFWTGLAEHPNLTFPDDPFKQADFTE